MREEATDVTLNRDRGIGGSDIPAVMGISPFVTRMDLLKYKLGIAENEFKGNEFTEYGNELEPKIRDYINSLGYDFQPDYIEESHEPLDRYYHADGFDDETETVLEIKTTGEVHSLLGYKKYLVQLLYGMKLFGVEEGILAVYNRPDDFDPDFDKERLQIFYIGMEDYESLLAEIDHAVAQFNTDFLFMEDNPWADDADLPSRSALMPLQNRLLEIEPLIVGANAIVKEYDEIKKQLCEQMEEHGIKSWTMPSGTKVTLVPKGEDKVVKAFDESRFAEEHEDLYDEYSIDKTKKGRSAYVRITPVAKGEKA